MPFAPSIATRFLSRVCLVSFFAAASSVRAVRPEDGAGAPRIVPSPEPSAAPTPALRAAAGQARSSGVEIQWGEGGQPVSVRGKDLGLRGAWSGRAGLAPGGRGDYAADAVAVLDRVAGLYGIGRADREFTSRRVQRDALGYHHTRLTQRHQGLRVVGGDLIVHFNKGGQAYEVNGSYVPGLQVAVQPVLSPEEAAGRAEDWLRKNGRANSVLSTAPELVVYARRTAPRLAYEVVRRCVSAGAAAERWRLWVNAQDGSLVAAFNDTPHVGAPTANGAHVAITGSLLAGEGGASVTVTGWYEYASSLYYLNHTSQHWRVFNVATSGGYSDLNTYAYRTNAAWGTSDQAEVSLASAFSIAQRYYAQVHGLNSFDGAGALAVANAHEGVSYVNAYWNGTAFFFGDGDGNIAHALGILDVSGHEFTHAVTEYSANLTYAGESGALNESFSDVMGTCIEFYSQPDDRASYPVRHAGQADWLCGEDCWLSSTALRDLRNPANPATVGAGNEQPTRYRGTYWDPNEEVHQNSGVQNFFFYLLCDGGSGVNDGLAYNVTGIGLTNAEQVAFRALTVYCTADTGYRAVRSAWLSAAQDLNPAWAASVAAAWSAVGVDAVAISPATGAALSGPVGGPFPAATAVYVITNAGASVVGWGASHTQAWLSVEPAGGTLDAGGQQSVTVSVNSAGHDLPVGTVADTVSFTNAASAAIETRVITLMVSPPVAYSFNLDSDPGWSVQGQWAYGTPGGGSDPASGHTGASVYGYNLAGNYTNNMPEHFLTSPAIDCTGLAHVRVSFWCWLGVESAVYDGAIFQASRDGINWSNVWEHSGADRQDVAWSLQTYDISALADGQATVYLRWGMGPTDGSVTYSGWNLDDISILGLSQDALRVRPGGGLNSAGYIAGPFAPTSQVYEVANAGTNGAALSWTATVLAAWVSLEPAGGTLAEGSTDSVTVALSDAITNFAAGTYTTLVTFSNLSSGQVYTRAVQVEVQEALAVSPAGGWVATGYLGGPFTPTSVVYTVTNRSSSDMAWQVGHTQAWLDVSAAGGTLGPGGSTGITVSLTPSAESLAGGVYGDTVLFSNTIRGATFARAVQLEVLASSHLTVTPAALQVTNVIGGVLTNFLTAANEADADDNLTFSVSPHTVGALPGAGFAAAAVPALSAAGRDFGKPLPGLGFNEGELLIRLKPGLTAGQQEAVLAALNGATVVRRYATLPGLVLVKLPPRLDVAHALPLLLDQPEVVYAQPNYRHHALDNLPDDARFGDLWGLHNTGQSGGTVDADVDAPAAWDTSIGDTNVIVCVVDTGVDYHHEDLRANLWRNPGELPGNGLDDDGNGYTDDVYGINGITGSGDPLDDHDHGTHCAGTIGGLGNNATGVVGVCWRVRVMAAKFLDASGSGSTADAITCMDYAVRMGAKILSNSWGGGGYEQALYDAIAMAGSSGVVFVAAAGNDSRDTDVTANYPSCYTSANVIAVMAVDRNDARSSFSNYGLETVDLGAPGSSILSCKRGGGYQLMSGTSMATPHVAGAGALLLAQNPGLPVANLKAALLSTVDPTLSGQSVSGGRMNVARALQSVVPAWFEVQPRGATNLPPGAATNLAVVFNAVGCVPGVYSGEVYFASNDLNLPVLRVPVTMTVLPDDLRLSPAGDLHSSGLTNGPFAPTSMVYAVSNASTSARTWLLGQTSSWVTVSSTGGSLAAGATTSLTVALHASAAALPAGSYLDTLTFSNAANGVVQTRQVHLTVSLPRPDYFTELFATDNDLENLSLTLTPDGSAGFYAACRTAFVTNFPTDPAGGTSLSLADDSFVAVAFSAGFSVPFFGTPRTNLFVGSNGFVTFGAGSSTYAESLADHFALPRVSGLFDDLDPTAGGTVSWKQLADRVAVTYQEVPEYSATNTASFQIELFTNGVVRLTWLARAVRDGLVGLSRGQGLPVDFQESNLSAYDLCPDGDSDGDGMDDAWETAHGLTVGINDATNNPDGDAWDNWQEYVADTAPLSSNPPLQMLVILSTNGVQVLAGPATTNSRLYDLQATTNLVLPAWQLIRSNLTGAADGQALPLVFTNASDAQVLRVDVHLP